MPVSVFGYSFHVNLHSKENIIFVRNFRSHLTQMFFIGMHGAGMSHGLFQPDWGALFEL